MTDKDEAEFGMLLLAVAEVTGRDLSAQAIGLYWEILKKYDISTIRRALQSHMSNPDVGQFMPKPADIERVIQGDTQTQALQAWGLVKWAIGSVGAYESVTFADIRIQAALCDMGGWVKLCHSSEKDITFLGSDFQTRYRFYSIHPPLTWSSHLCGIIEQQSLMDGYPLPAPRAIGDLDQARKIYLTAGGDPELIPYIPQPPVRPNTEQIPDLSRDESSDGVQRITAMINKCISKVHIRPESSHEYAR